MSIDGVSEATIGPGFLLDFNIGAGWVHVGEIKDIAGPTESTDEVDVTNQDSLGGYKEIRPSLQDGGTLTFDMNSVPTDAGQQAIADIKHDRTVADWRILMGDTGWYKHFAGFINTFGNQFPVANAMLRNVGVRVTGPVTETEAVS